MFTFIQWSDYVEKAPKRAMETKLLTLIDRYAVSQDIADMRELGDAIDAAVRVIALCHPHYQTLQPGRYVELKCKEIILAGYCLIVQPPPPSFPVGRLLYKVYHVNNGRNVLTSTWS